MNAVRVYIATTQGPSEVQRIAEEDPKVRSVVCLNGTSEALPISAAYDAFVRKPTGVIEKKFGHSVYRLDVSERISDGKSWQLGFFAAHALFSVDRLAGKGEIIERAVWVTGEVDRDLNVNPVDHVEEKLRQSAPLFAELKAAGIPLTIFVPQKNAGELKATWKDIVPLETVQEMYRELGLDEKTRSVRSESIAGVIGFGALLAALIGGVLWQGDILDRLREVRESDVTVVTEKKPEKTELLETSLELTAIEHRVLGRCPTIFPGGAAYDLVALDKTDIEHFTASAWEGLCAVEYGFHNASEKPVHAWIKGFRLGSEQRFSREQRLPGIKNRELAPGEKISITMVLPRWSKQSITVRIIAAAGPNAPQETEKWLAKAETDNLRRAGLAVRMVEHAINRPAKPRFN